MQHGDHEDPDSGHPTPRDYFNPDEATTSTPISSRLRPGVRPNSRDSDSFSPRPLFASPRLPNAHSNGYTVVTEVIEMARKKKQLEDENDMMRNLSMRSEQELDDSKARIAELEEQISEFDETKSRIADLQEQARYLSVNSPIPDSRAGEIKEMEERWKEDRRLLEKEKEEMEVKLKEELEIERKKVQQLQEWQLKCEMVETENGLISKRTASAIEKKDALLKEKEEEVEELRTRIREMDRLSIASDGSSTFELGRRVKEQRNAAFGQELSETRDEISEEIHAVDDLRRINGELEGRLATSEKELEEAKKEMEDEKKRMKEAFQSEKNELMNSTTSIVERNDALLKEKDEEMKEEKKRMQMEVDGMVEESKRKEKEMEDSNNEMAELRKKLMDSELMMERMNEEKGEMDTLLEKNEKEMKELLEKNGEMELRMSELSAEGERLRDMELKCEDLEKKITIANEALIEKTTHCEELKSLKDEYTVDNLALKTKVHEQKSTIDNLNRVNEELEESKREGRQVKEQLNEKTEEGKKMKSEMDQLKADVVKRREVQKRLEDELDIARKMSQDARDEVNRVKEECAREKEDRRMEWMDKELRDSEEVKEKMDKEREEMEKLKNEALTEVNKHHQLYENLLQQFNDYKTNADLLYVTEMAEKGAELSAVRERLAELEDYPGMLVSVDGRDSEGRSVYDVLPDPVKNFIDQATDASVRRAVAFSKSMVIRGEVNVSTSSFLPLLIERLEEMEMCTPTFENHRDFLVRIFKKLKEEEGSEELMTSLAARLDGELAHLEEEWMNMEKSNEEMEERARRSEEDVRRMEDETIRADDGRKKALIELKDVRESLKHTTAEKETYQECAEGFREKYDEKVDELKEADDELNELREEYHIMVDEKERKIREQDQEICELEKKLEDQIGRFSDLSTRLMDQSSELHSVKEEKGTLKRELERYKSNKRKLIGLIDEYMDGLWKHFEVYKKVKARNDKRRILLEGALRGIEETRREMEKANAREGYKIMKELETTLRSDLLDFLGGDGVDYTESDRLKKHIHSLTEDNKHLTEEDKENIAC